MQRHADYTLQHASFELKSGQAWVLLFKLKKTNNPLGKGIISTFLSCWCFFFSFSLISSVILYDHISSRHLLFFIWTMFKSEIKSLSLGGEKRSREVPLPLENWHPLHTASYFELRISAHYFHKTRDTSHIHHGGFCIRKLNWYKSQYHEEQTRHQKNGVPGTRTKHYWEDKFFKYDSGVV